MIVEPNQTLCSPSEQLAFSIVAAGNALCDSNWHATEHSPPYTRLYYILDGAGEVETQQGPLHLTTGMLYMLPVGYSFSYHCTDRMHQLYFHIHLTNPYGADLLRGIDRILAKPISTAYMKQLLTLLQTDSVVSRGYLKALLQADVFSLLSNDQIDIQSKQRKPFRINSICHPPRYPINSKQKWGFPWVNILTTWSCTGQSFC